MGLSAAICFIADLLIRRFAVRQFDKLLFRLIPRIISLSDRLEC